MNNLRNALFAEATKPAATLPTQNTWTKTSSADEQANAAGTTSGAELSLTSSVLDLVPGAGHDKQSSIYTQFKQRIHNKLIDSINIAALVNIQGGKALESAIERTIH